MKKCLKSVIYTLSTIVVIWFIASCLDIVVDNTTNDPHHYSWNFFCLIGEEDNKPEEIIYTVESQYCADGHVEDEAGNIWHVAPDTSLTAGDSLLLRISDNGTPDDIVDDVIISVWKEA